MGLSTQTFTSSQKQRHTCFFFFGFFTDLYFGQQTSRSKQTEPRNLLEIISQGQKITYSCLWRHFSLKWVLLYNLAYFMKSAFLTWKMLRYMTWVLIDRMVNWKEALKKKIVSTKRLLLANQPGSMYASWLQLMKSSWIALKVLYIFRGTVKI